MSSLETSKQEMRDLLAAGDLEAAEVTCRHLIESCDADENVYMALAGICIRRGKPGEAAMLLHAALGLRPDFPEALMQLGKLLILNKPHRAEQHVRKAMALKPGLPGANAVLADVLYMTGDIHGAIAAYRKAVEEHPNNHVLHTNLGTALLTAGQFEEGFVEVEHRLRQAGYKRMIRFPWDKPQWDGRFDPSRTLLLFCEPGFGDLFMYLRLAGRLRGRGMRIALMARAGLAPLLMSSGLIDEFIPIGCDYDARNYVWCPLFSLPALTGLNAQTLGCDKIPYLFAEPGLARAWKERLPSGKLLVGINWQGNPMHEKGLNTGRSAPLEAYRLLAEIPGVQLVSLQKMDGLDQIAPCSFRDRLIVFDDAEYRKAPAFLDAAAIISNLDLVVTSDTAMAHLAGALGAKTWVALAYVPDWRWMLERTDSPWYPNTRLYRQSENRQWPEVMERMAADLRTMADTQR